MNKKNLMPQAAQPVNRVNLGQLPSELAELNALEAALELYGDSEVGASYAGVLQSARYYNPLQSVILQPTLMSLDRYGKMAI